MIWISLKIFNKFWFKKFVMFYMSTSKSKWLNNSQFFSKLFLKCWKILYLCALRKFKCHPVTLRQLVGHHLKNWRRSKKKRILWFYVTWISDSVGFHMLTMYLCLRKAISVNHCYTWRFTISSDLFHKLSMRNEES